MIGRQLPGQRRIVAEGLLDARHLLDGQGLVQVGFEIALAEGVGHGIEGGVNEPTFMHFRISASHPTGTTPGRLPPAALGRERPSAAGRSFRTCSWPRFCSEMPSRAATSLFDQPRTQSNSMHCSRSHCPRRRQWAIISPRALTSAVSSRPCRSRLRTMLLARRPRSDRLPAVAAFLGHQRQRGPAAFMTQEVGQLVGGDGEQIALQRLIRVVVRQAVEEADEGLLDQVLGRGPIGHPAGDEAQQPAFVARDELVPGVGLAGADARDQQGFGTAGGHGRTANIEWDVTDHEVTKAIRSRAIWPRVSCDCGSTFRLPPRRQPQTAPGQGQEPQHSAEDHGRALHPPADHQPLGLGLDPLLHGGVENDQGVQRDHVLAAAADFHGPDLGPALANELLQDIVRQAHGGRLGAERQLGILGHGPLQRLGQLPLAFQRRREGAHPHAHRVTIVLHLRRGVDPGRRLRLCRHVGLAGFRRPGHPVSGSGPRRPAPSRGPSRPERRPDATRRAKSSSAAWSRLAELFGGDGAGVDAIAWRAVVRSRLRLLARTRRRPAAS